MNMDAFMREFVTHKTVLEAMVDKCPVSSKTGAEIQRLAKDRLIQMVRECDNYALLHLIINGRWGT